MSDEKQEVVAVTSVGSKEETAVMKPAEIKSPVKTAEEVQADFLAMVSQYGNVETTPEQQAILFAAVDPEEVQIRPDGLVFLSWTAYVKRLRDAFNTRWSLMPRGNPAVREGMVMAAYYLCIQGKVAGYAVGEAQQQGQMTYGDVLESAKSNALTRLCKGMGISLELWDPNFVREWKNKYAVQDVPHPKKQGEFLWRRRGAEPRLRPEATTLSGGTSDPVPETVVAKAVALMSPEMVKEMFKAKDKEFETHEGLDAAQKRNGVNTAPENSPAAPGPTPPPVQDRHSESVAGVPVKQIEVKVKEVNVHRPGKTSRAKNPSYRIVDVAGTMFYTFDKTQATVANEARKSGVSVRIDYETTAYGFKIVQLKTGPFDQPLPLK